jgi:transposase-like protein
MTYDWLVALRARWQQALSWRGPCPHCRSKRVWHNGIRHRKANIRQGYQTVYIHSIPVRRLRCGDCVRRWSRPPERVPTRSQYQPCVVAPAVTATVLEVGSSDTEVAKTYGCHRRTLLRWVARVAQVGDPGQLARRLLAESDSPQLPAPPPQHRSRRSAGLVALGQRAVEVLALLEALGSLFGLEPPGLAHAWQFVPALVPPSAAAL